MMANNWITVHLLLCPSLAAMVLRPVGTMVVAGRGPWPPAVGPVA